LLQGCAEAEELRLRRQQAQQRLQLLEELKRLLQKGAPDAIDAVASKLGAGYVHSMSAAVDQALGKLRLRRALRDALQAVPPSAVQIAVAWEAFRAAGLSLDDARVVARCQHAVRQRRSLDRLQNLAPGMPLDKQDAVWLSEWQEGRLADCPD